MTMAYQGRFLVGTVISQTFTAFFSKLLPFGGFALIGFIPTMIFLGGYFYFIFYVLGFSGFPGFDGTGQPFGSGQPFNPRDMSDLPWGWIITAFVVDMIASIATTAIWLAATSYGAFQYLRGQPVRFWASLRRGVSVALPCIGATFLISLVLMVVSGIVAIPLFLLIDQAEADTPGVLFTVLFMFLTFIFVFTGFIFIICRMWVAIPTIAVERPGVLAALRRSWDLTRGHAMRVFGIMLVMWAGTMGASVAAGIVVFIAIIAIGGIAGLVIGQGLNILVSLLANALYAIAAAVSYVELRRAKEGFGIEDIAAVFD